MKSLAIVFGLLISTPSLALEVIYPTCLDKISVAAEKTAIEYLQENSLDHRNLIQKFFGDTVLNSKPWISIIEEGSAELAMTSFHTKQWYGDYNQPIGGIRLDRDGFILEGHTYSVFVTYDSRCEIVSQVVRATI